MGRRKKKNTETRIRQKWKIALYIRLSREDDNEDESNSVKEQRKILMEFVIEYFSDEYEIVDVYIDDGKTGTTDDTRDDFGRMIDDMYAGKVNCIICKTLSRAFRNYADQGKYLEEIFPKYGVRFISVNNPHVDSLNDLDTIQNGLEIPINGLMNDRFAAKTSVDVRRSFEGKRKRGEFIGAFAPYGYLKDPENKNHLIIDKDVESIIVDIYQWFIDGMSKNGIAKKLNGMGVPNPSLYKTHIQKFNYKNPKGDMNDGRWDAMTVSRILQNQMYVGHMVQGKERVISYKIHDTIRVSEDEWIIVKNTHEAIISEETFKLAQELHKKDTNSGPGNTEVHMYAGMLRCKDCGKALRRKKSGYHIYFFCRTYNDKKYCSQRSIREDRLSKAVLHAIRMQINTIESMSQTLDEINKKPTVKTHSKRLANMLNAKEKELSNVTKVADSLYYDWKSNIISKNDFIRMKSNSDDQIVRLKENISKIKKEMNLMENGIASDDPYLVAFLKNKNIETLDRGLLVQLIDEIYLHENGEITISFRFEDEIERVADYIKSNNNQLRLVSTESAS